MPTEVFSGNFRRFLLDIEEDEIFLKFDVHILEKEPEPWVEIYRMGDGTETDFVKVPIITAPASEVAELLEKILSYIKSVVGSMKDIGFYETEIL
jgi:hypothetical protein